VRAHGLATRPDGRACLSSGEHRSCQAAPAIVAAPLRNPFVWTALASALLGVGSHRQGGVLARADARRPAFRARCRHQPTADAGVPQTIRRRRCYGERSPDIGLRTNRFSHRRPKRWPLYPSAARSADDAGSTSHGVAEAPTRQKQAASEEELRAALKRVPITDVLDHCARRARRPRWFRANDIAVDDRDVDRSESARRAQLMLNRGHHSHHRCRRRGRGGLRPEYMQDVLRRAVRRRAHRP